MMSEFEEQTTEGSGQRMVLPTGIWYVVVLCHDQTTRHVLPDLGEITVGRGKDAGIRINHISVSRIHACFKISDKVTVTDLGSFNGTTVRDMKLEPNKPVEVFPNDVVDLGHAMLVVKNTQCFSSSVQDAGLEIPLKPIMDTYRPSHNVIVVNKEMHRIHRLVERIAASELSVLLLGETGVGKEVFAERLHTCSKRVEKPLVRINCAAFPETLLESELFGHMRGSFSGADSDKPGILESGKGGTVFLDEVGEMPLSLQTKLLRAIEERKVLRIGSLEPREIDVRFVSATNTNLETKIRNGEFREDFYYRLNGISILIPSLRERPDEIQPLAESFIRAHAHSQQLKRTPLISQVAMVLLRNYSWPGNIRELRNAMERAVVLSDGVIKPEHLPAEISTSQGLVVENKFPVLREDAVDNSLSDKDHAEKIKLIEILNSCAGNQTNAAKQLGISRSTLIRRLDRLDIPRPRKK